jgi:hypothetical protein
MNNWNPIEWIKLSPKLLFAACFATGLLLWANEDVLRTLGLQLFVCEYRSWIGVGFLVFFATLSAHGIAAVYDWLKKLILRWRASRHRIKRLHHLTQEEKKILHYYIARQTRTQLLPVDSGVASGLQAERIIAQATTVGDWLDGIAYNIQPWAWDYLNKHPELVEPT